MWNIREQLKNAISEIVKETTGQDVEPKLEHPAVEEHGDYATNIALTVWSRGPSSAPGMTKYATPLELAEAIAEKLRNNLTIEQFRNRIKVVPPGFINFWISPDVLLRELRKVGEDYGKSNLFVGQTVVVDYSGPNIAKSFGIGHLRSTIIGQAIYNLYKFLGARVIGDNHLGDWGRQFGVLLAMIAHGGVISTPQERGRDLSLQARRDDRRLESLTTENLEKMYVEFHKEAETTPELWNEARLWFKKLEDGDQIARDIWQKVKDLSLTEFNRIYNMLGVAIDYAYGESYYEKLMPEVVEECKEKGIAKESEGALIVEFEDLSPAILVKSDGATNYFTRDLATIKFRLKEWEPDLILYEVGAEQALHFQQLFQTAKLLGWMEKTRFVHIKHGLYLAPSGKKFSTRKGDTVHLEEVLDEAIERACKLARGDARGSSVISNESEESLANASHLPCDDISTVVGVGAVKYFDLSHHPSSNIVFDWDKIMALEGNSAPYLQYTYARCRSVLEKAVVSSSSRRRGSKNLDWIPACARLAAKRAGMTQDFQPEELAVLRTFYKFPEVVEEAAASFSPNLICNFLFDLAQKYNTFYNAHRILGEKDHSPFRLALTAAVGNILKTGLNLLGIEAPAKM